MASVPGGRMHDGEPHQLREVSCRVTRYLLDELEAKQLPPEALTAGLPYGVDHLRDRRQWLDWASFMTLCRAIPKVWSDEEQRELSHRSVHAFEFRLLRLVASALYTPRDVYFWMPGLMRQVYRCVLISIDEPDPGVLRYQLSLPSGYGVCPALINGHAHLLEALPGVLGLPHAKVDVEELRDGVLFRIELPSVVRLGTKLRKWLHDLVASPEMREAQVLLRRTLEDLSDELVRRERVEIRLRHREAQFRELAENFSHVVWLYDLTCPENSYVSSRNTELFGSHPWPQTAGEWLGIVHPRDRERMASAFREQWHDRAFEEEYRISASDGNERWLRAKGVPVRDARGDVISFVGFVEDVTTQRRAQRKLEASRERLRELTDRIETMREAERTAVAREVYDSLGQALTALRFDLVRAAGDPSRLNADSMQAMISSVETMLGVVRSLGERLRPSILDGLGLPATIEWEADRFTKQSGIRCELDLDAPDLPPNPRHDTTAYRILQESLSNVAQHARADSVRIGLRVESSDLVLEIEDDGCGISDRLLGSSLSGGLLGMQLRAAAIGGNARISRHPAGGTIVALRLPLR